jgi:hypothetical protein
MQSTVDARAPSSAEVDRSMPQEMPRPLPVLSG